MRSRLVDSILLITLGAGLGMIVMAFSTAAAQDAGPDAGAEIAAADAGNGVSGAADGPAVPAEIADDPAGAVERLVSAISEGNARLAVALGLGIFMLIIARTREKIPWFRGDRGGAIAVMLLALLGAGSTLLLSDATLDYKLFVGWAGIAWTAVGGYTWIKRLIWPKDQVKAA